MMKLSTMKKVVDTVDEHWESPLAESILERWGYDPGSAKYFRSSANFVFVFQNKGQYFFLRFNDSVERELERIESELTVVRYLKKSAAQPVKSLNGNDIETVTYDGRTYYAVVFEALKGTQYDFEELHNNQFFAWGKALGALHKAIKEIPERVIKNRPTWEDQMTMVKAILPETETAALSALEKVEEWAKGLTANSESFGLVHYDFECDNLYWNEDKISILDFDDCACYWYVADIAYALRDLFEEGLNLENPAFKTFMTGYQSKAEIDDHLIEELPSFMRMHDLISFAKLLRSVDIPESDDHPEWLGQLRQKLVWRLDQYRQSFA